MSTTLTRPIRANETRENEPPRGRWKPASLLPDPNYRPDRRHRYCAVLVAGAEATSNMSRNIGDGWIPCKAEDYPEVTGRLSGHSGKGDIVSQGLMLCYMPEEIAQERDEYFRSLGAMTQQDTNSLMAGVDTFGTGGTAKVDTRTSVTRGKPISFSPDSE